MHRRNYPEQKIELDFVVYMYMYATNIATLNNTRFILLHEIRKHQELNDPLLLLILNRMTGRYAPGSTV